MFISRMLAVGARLSGSVAATLLIVWSLLVGCQSGRLDARAESDQPVHGDASEDGWDFEPRIWSPDPIGVGQHQSDPVDDDNFQLAEPPPSHGLDGDQLAGYGPQTLVAQTELYHGASVRRRSYFKDVSRNIGIIMQNSSRFKWKAPSLASSKRRPETVVGPLFKLAPDESNCDQYRADTRDTIICDRRRCDKFEFEWPKHENQLTLIETTKYGMRFHRADYAFGLESASRMREIDHQFVALNLITGETIDSGARERIKFDLFELFKPKPKPSIHLKPGPATSSSTTTEAATTTTTTTETTDTTSAPVEPTTRMDEPTTTSLPTNMKEPSENSNSHDKKPIERQDDNSTRLITTFRLDSGRRRQQMLGFGGALSDSTCRNIKSLSPTMAKSLMEDYFGHKGLGYSVVRMTIGSSDFSTTPYTNNDRPTSTVRGHGENREQQQQQQQQQTDGQQMASDNNYDNNSSDHNRYWLDEEDDLEMRKFRLVEEDYEFKLPVARQAVAISKAPIRFLSSLWSPPSWMKNNSNIIHGCLKGDVYGPYYKALADYIIKWLEAYRRNGIEFWATTGLNEPITGTKPYIYHNSLGITREDYATFIKLYLGPMLRQRGFSNLKLIALDDNKGYAPNFVKLILDDQEVSRYVSGIGIHWYMNDEYENLDFLARNYPEKFLISTEACNGYLPFQVHTLPGNWDRGVAYFLDIIKTIQKNAAAWVDWNMVLDLYGGPTWAKNPLDSPVIVNANRDEYYKSPSFYAIGHFSRFVEPNSSRLDHRLANANYDLPVEAVGFRTPSNYIVIIATNTNRYPIEFKIIVDRTLVKVIKLREESFNTIVFKWKMKN